MIKTVEGSIAVAHAVRNCEIDLAACFPITPSTHIAEELERLYANGEIKNYITTESEFTSISALIGASAAGARAFSATSSQGLALMHEALFNASGMRLPMVLAVGNRSLSAPLNIWNDHQDSISERDNGWIQLYCENNQEAVDNVIQAFRISETARIPVMVCMDGFFLTHTTEQIDIPELEKVRKFAPKGTWDKLDPNNPLTFGAYASPEHYQMFREDLHEDLMKSKTVIEETGKEFGKNFGREYGLVEDYKTKDSETIIICMGSSAANAKNAVDESESVGLLRVRCYRPFPYEQIRRICEDAKKIIVFEKAMSAGSFPPLFSEVCSMFQGKNIISVIGGLGGRDVTAEHFKKMLDFEKSGFIR